MMVRVIAFTFMIFGSGYLVHRKMSKLKADRELRLSGLLDEEDLTKLTEK